MKILVTGVKGQLGYDVCRELTSRGIENLGVDKDDFDITDEIAVRDYILAYKPDAVVHCSAYTAVDRAEDEEDLCYKVNVDGVVNIAKVCKQLDIKLMYISTDYVFEGTGIKPYEVNDRTNPVSVYGRTKLQGEVVSKKLIDKLFIVRISWVFGINGNNFLKTMLRLGKERCEVSVVSDQIGSPTYTKDLAVLLCDMIVTDKYGTYHGTNEGFCSWAELAEEVFKVAKLDVKVNYIATEDYPTKAKRPLNSRLSKDDLDRAGFKRLPDWKLAVSDYVTQINK